MKNISGIVIGLAIFAAVSFGIRTMAGGRSVNGQITKMCEEMKTKLPMMIDEITRLDTVEPGDHSVTYLYTLIGVEDSAWTDEAKASVESEVRTEVQNSSQLDVMRKHHVDMGYVYRNEAGNELFRFVIDH